ncbi:hypothetical protein TorRG33x02_152460 [Trema orientale]|uniref:Uncharacterized protein n=1 Tax=Trema orientale TaxID=63057 RepID=A0A2P5EU25_TREOI|nr:hypothetical protein TorRG33x02_152460 [Trema orientale]
MTAAPFHYYYDDCHFHYCYDDCPFHFHSHIHQHRLVRLVIEHRKGPEMRLSAMLRMVRGRRCPMSVEIWFPIRSRIRRNERESAMVTLERQRRP